MSRFASKEALLAEIAAKRAALDKVLDGLTDEQMLVPGVCGVWSAKDIVAHLAEWQRMVLGWYAAGVRGETVKTPAPDLNWAQTPTLNQRIYERHKDVPLAEVRADFAATDADLVALVRALSEAELLEAGAHAWTGKNALASYVSPCTCGHYEWARKLIRGWRKTLPTD